MNIRRRVAAQLEGRQFRSSSRFVRRELLWSPGAARTHGVKMPTVCSQPEL